MIVAVRGRKVRACVHECECVLVATQEDRPQLYIYYTKCSEAILIACISRLTTFI